jgi:acyl carrier protein
MNDFPQTPAEVLSRIDSLRRPRPALDTPFLLHRDAVEEMLAGIWAEVLGLQQVGIDDNFFALGGDSLRMTQIASRVRASCDIEISFREFFDNPTVAGLAEIIRERSKNLADKSTESADKPDSTVSVLRELELQDETAKKPRLLPRLPQEGKPLSVNSIVIATRGRPAALRRCLFGLLENLSRYGRTPRIIVMDQTSDGGLAEANQEVVRQVLGTFRFNVTLAGAEDMRNLSNRLIQAGLSKEVVEFGFQGLDHLGLGAEGANRNLLLLATAGEAFLSIDDDTECRFACAPTFQSRLGNSSGPHPSVYDPVEIWTYDNRESLLSSVQLTDIDFVGGHEELLGRETLHLAAVVEAEPKLQAGDLSRLRQNPGRIMVTLNGSVGDCGWGSPSRYLFIDDSSFERLTRSEQGYSSGTTSRDILRVTPSFIITERINNLMTTLFGADNRTILPPFVPVGRGADVVFGQMLKKVEPHGWFGHLPWAILHAPLEQKRFWPGEVLRSAATTDLKGMFCTLISGLVDNETPNADSALRKMGQALIEIGNQPIEDFQAFLVERGRARVEDEIAFLEDRAQRFGGVATPWARDVNAYISALKQNRNQLTAAIPAELLYGRDILEAVRLARQIVSLYGHFLSAWPLAVSIMRDLE